MDRWFREKVFSVIASPSVSVGERRFILPGEDDGFFRRTRVLVRMVMVGESTLSNNPQDVTTALATAYGTHITILTKIAKSSYQ